MATESTFAFALLVQPPHWAPWHPWFSSEPSTSADIKRSSPATWPNWRSLASSTLAQRGFVVRDNVSETSYDEILRRLPFKPELMICPARDVLALARNWFADAPVGKDVGRFVSVRRKRRARNRRFRWQPAGAKWEVGSRHHRQICIKRATARSDVFQFRRREISLRPRHHPQLEYHRNHLRNLARTVGGANVKVTYFKLRSRHPRPEKFAAPLAQ